MLLEHPEYSTKIFGACKVTDKLKTFSWSFANAVVSGYLQLRSGKLEGAYKLSGTNGIFLQRLAGHELFAARKIRDCDFWWNRDSGWRVAAYLLSLMNSKGAADEAKIQ